MKKIISFFKSLMGRKEKGVAIHRGAHVYPRACLRATRGGRIIVGKALINDNAFVCASGGLVEIGDNVTINRNSIIVAKEEVK